jgi:hypothetical protein
VNAAASVRPISRKNFLNIKANRTATSPPRRPASKTRKPKWCIAARCGAVHLSGMLNEHTEANRQPRVSVTLDPQLGAAVEHAARREGRPVSNFVARLIAEAVAPEPPELQGEPGGRAA